MLYDKVDDPIPSALMTKTAVPLPWSSAKHSTEDPEAEAEKTWLVPAATGDLHDSKVQGRVLHGRMKLPSAAALKRGAHPLS